MELRASFAKIIEMRWAVMEVLSEDALSVRLNGLKRRGMSVSKRTAMTLTCNVDDHAERQRLMARSLHSEQKFEPSA